MSIFPNFDEVHVISDIHMGGKPGFQILRETNRLAGYIGWVAGQSPDGRVALVLNGDVFDTLAEDIQGYVAVDRAVETLERIMDDESFSGVLESARGIREGRPAHPGFCDWQPRYRNGISHGSAFDRHTACGR